MSMMILPRHTVTPSFLLSKSKLLGIRVLKNWSITIKSTKNSLKLSNELSIRDL